MIFPSTYYTGFAPRDGFPACPRLWDGCIGAWCPSLGPTGLVLRDWSGLGSHGILTNTTLSTAWTISSGKYAVLLDGSNDQIVMGDLACLEPSFRVSITAWVIPTVSTQATDASILSKEYSNPRGSPFCSYKFGVSGSQKYKFEFANGGAIRQVIGSTSPSAGVQVFLAGTYDGAIARLYVNGVQEATLSTSGNLAYSNGRLLLGTDETGGSPYSGAVDDIRVYDRALTTNDISFLYCGGRGRGIAYTLQDMVYASAAQARLLRHPGMNGGFREMAGGLAG